VGRLGLSGNSRTFTSQANARISLSDHPTSWDYASPRETLTWKTIAYLSWPIRTNRSGFMVSEIGPCEDLRVVAYERLWANSSSSATAECFNHGPMRELARSCVWTAVSRPGLIGNGRTLGSQANARMSLGNHPAS
jgi:hypothetical protein